MGQGRCQHDCLKVLCCRISLTTRSEDSNLPNDVSYGVVQRPTDTRTQIQQPSSPTTALATRPSSSLSSKQPAQLQAAVTPCHPLSFQACRRSRLSLTPFQNRRLWALVSAGLCMRRLNCVQELILMRSACFPLLWNLQLWMVMPFGAARMELALVLKLNIALSSSIVTCLPNAMPLSPLL